MASRTPAPGLGTSASTLSVEISRIGSSFSTRSPAFFSHLETVPSVIDSPIWGITTSTLIAFYAATIKQIGYRKTKIGANFGDGGEWFNRNRSFFYAVGQMTPWSPNTRSKTLSPAEK